MSYSEQKAKGNIRIAKQYDPNHKKDEVFIFTKEYSPEDGSYVGESKQYVSLEQLQGQKDELLRQLTDIDVKITDFNKVNVEVVK